MSNEEPESGHRIVQKSVIGVIVFIGITVITAPVCSDITLFMLSSLPGALVCTGLVGLFLYLGVKLHSKKS